MASLCLVKFTFLGFVACAFGGAFETRDNGSGDHACGVCTCGDSTCQGGSALRPVRSDTGGLQCPSKEWYYCDCRTAAAPFDCKAGQCGSCHHCTDLGCKLPGYFRQGCGFGSPGICVKCASCPGGMVPSGGCKGEEDTHCVFLTTPTPTFSPTLSPSESPTIMPSLSPTASPTVSCDASNYQQQTARAKGAYHSCMAQALLTSIYDTCKCINNFNCEIRSFSTCSTNEGKYIAKMLHDDDCAIYGPCVDSMLY